MFHGVHSSCSCLGLFSRISPTFASFKPAAVVTVVAHEAAHEVASGGESASFRNPFRRQAGAMVMRLAAAVMLCLCAVSARAATWTVDTLNDDSTTSPATAQSNCGSGNSNTCALRDAILAAGSGDTIVFNSGLTGTITLGSVLNIETSMTINGPGSSLLTVSGNHTTQVFMIGQSSPATVSISGLTIANGNSVQGGGIFNYRTLTVTNSAFSGNTAGSGGGIWNNATLTVTNSTFSGNTAASVGGGIWTNDTATVTNSTFLGNSAPDQSGSGGGIANDSGALTVTNSTFSGNSASYGGGIANFTLFSPGVLTANNNIFSGNAAANFPGASPSGAGIYNYYKDGSGSVSASYNVFYNNLDTGGSEDDCGNCFSPNSKVGANPNLLPLGYYGGPTETMALLPGSAAICVGNAAYVPSGVTTDQRGFALDATCSSGSVDAGAVQTNQYVVTTVQDNADSSPECASGTGTTCSLRDAIGLADSLPNTGGADITFLPSLTSAGSQTITLGAGTAGDQGLPEMTGQVNILGPGANWLTISGNNDTKVGTVLRFQPATTSVTAMLYGLAVAGGNTGGVAAGIYSGGSLTVIASAISGNSANGPGAGGGGIYAASGTLTLTGSTVSGNSVTCSGSGCLPVSGGGIATAGGAVTLTNSTVSGNSANGPGAGGGGIFINSDTLALTNSTVSGNSVTCGSGCAIAGGGIFNDSGTLTLANSIVAGNSTSTSGGASASYADINGTYTDNGGNAADNSSSATSPYQSAILLSALQYNGIGATLQTMIPLPGSMAICAGKQSNIPSGVTTDERGYPNTNTTYSGYNSTTRCVDAGAVQTDYTSVGFVTQPTNTVVNTAITPSPAVEVEETNASTGATDGVSGVQVALTYSGGSSEIATPANLTATTAPTTVGMATVNEATFSGLDPNTVGTGFTLSISPITVTTLGSGTTLDALPSNTFDVTEPQPTVTGISPSSGPAAGGTAVTITGTNFTGATGVTIGGTAAASVVVVSSTSITAVTPAGTAGTASVVVTTTGGSNAANTLFTYIGSQTISFANPGTQTVGTPLTLSATASSGLAVTFTSTTTGICTVSGTTATFIASGTCTIDANQAGNSTYAAAPQVQQSFTVNGEAQTVTFPTIPAQTVGTPLALSATASSGLTVSFTSTTTSVCTVSGTTATFIASGTCTIDANQAGNSTYAAAPQVQQSFTVNAAPTFTGGGGGGTISIEPGATTGNTVTISATPSNGFTGTVNLSCSISPTAASDPATCSLAPSSVTISGSTAQTSTLTINTTASTIGANQMKHLFWQTTGGTTLAVILIFGIPRRRRNWLVMLVLLVLFVSIGSVGCGGSSGGGGGGGGGNAGTTPGTYTVTVTGTSGSLTVTLGTVTLVVQ
jgi:IPT/TIG domain-containing protein